jgi:hypothetical protein
MYVIKDLQDLAMFIKEGGDYRRLGHPKDAGLLELRKAVGDVLANVGEKAVKAALGVIEEAIREAGWLTVVIGEHRNDDPSFETAEKLRVRILGGIYEVTGRDFCNRADMDKAHCGCLRLETCTKLAVEAAEGIGKCLGAYAKERSRENSAALCAALWNADLQAFRLEYEQYISTPDVRVLLIELADRNAL